jgi:superkiller protein 3
LVGDLERLGRHEEAIAEFRPLLNRQSRNPYFWYLLGELHESAGNTAAAEASYQKALSLGRAPESAAALGVLWLKQNQLEPGRQQLQKALAEDPKNREARGALVKLHISQGDLSAAEGLVREGRREEPKDPDWLEDLAKLLHLQGKSQAAFTAYQELAELNPNSEEAHRRLSEYYLERRLWPQAIAELEWLQKARPADPLLRRNLGLAYYESGRYEEAREQLLPLSEQKTADALSHFLLGSIYKHKQLWRLAAQEFFQTVELDSGFVEAKLEWANTLIEIGENGQALALLEEVEDSVQGSPERLTRFGILLLSLKQPDRALNVLQAAAHLAPRDAQVVFQLGRAYLDLDRFPEAVSAWERAIKLDPKLAEAYNHLGYLHAERGQKLDQAVRWLQRALQLDPTNGNYYDSLGWAYYQQQKYSAALREIQRAIEFFHSRNEQIDPVVFEHLGYIYQKLGRLQEAESAWQQVLTQDPNNAAVQKALRGLRSQGRPATP